MMHTHPGRPSWLVVVLASAFAALAVSPAYSQQAPNAGDTLRDLTQKPLVPSGPERSIAAPILTPERLNAQGLQVKVQEIGFDGNTVIPTVQLHAVVAPWLNTTADGPALDKILEAVTAHYRAAGYSFAKAVFPEQDLTDGKLRVLLIEGRFGKALAVSDRPEWEQGANAWLEPFQNGSVIRDQPLSRALTLLGDLPGIQITPVLKPGQMNGTGDLEVLVELRNRWQGSLRLDNQGNYYNGQYRALVDASANSLLMFGDQVAANIMFSQQNLYLGSLAYMAPIGGSGLRWNAQVSRTDYKLAYAFDGFYGTADQWSGGVSFPVVRTGPFSLTLTGSVQYRRLFDHRNDSSFTTKRSYGVPIGFSFDSRDAWLGGGVNLGSFSYLTSYIQGDAITTPAHFRKLNLELSRQQRLPWGLIGSARWVGQLAYNNLDSSEVFVLGGPTAVRAYPGGEIRGDSGWYGQLELRYPIQNWMPFAFYDFGTARRETNRTTATPGADPIIAGAGLGLRYTEGDWTFGATLAWRVRGGRPVSDTHNDPKPRIWANAAYQF